MRGAVPNLYWPQRVLRSSRAKAARRLSRWEVAERLGTQAILVTHGSCLDGVGAAIVTQRALGSTVGVLYVHAGDMAEVLQWLAGKPAQGRRLLVADLSLQKDQFPAIVSACSALRASGWRIEWRDHHHKQWEGLDLAPLRACLDVLEVNADATESGASLQQKAFAPGDKFLAKLAHTIRDRDLWWNKTPDSETLEFALTEMGTKAFVRAYLAAHSDSPVVLPEVAEAAQRERGEQAAILGKLLAQARYFGDGPTRVGVIYGWLPKNTGLHELLADHGCQVAINVRPNGKVSLRSRKEAPVCHLVAQRHSGGGHPNASGCDLGLRRFAYLHYLLRRGKVPVVRRLAEAAVLQLAALEQAGVAAAPAGARGRS
ncbi:MAG TPA: hypothetical protein VM286_01850 [Candidatus Thermoplasmatota archaeon]|nr:hypothetical protein [Candidatus Thermoplasmatota archaeon]